MAILVEIVRHMLLKVPKAANKVLPLTEDAAAVEITIFGVNNYVLGKCLRCKGL